MGSESGPPRKRARARPEPQAVDEGLGGLYDFLPPPDPEKDAAALVAAAKNRPSRPKLPPEDRTKVIFLDVDGVLLPAGTVETIVIDGVALPVRDTIKESDFSAAALGNLRKIVEVTGASICLSSEWRRSETLKSSIAAVLKSHDVPVFRDATPIENTKPELQKAHHVLGWCERRAREIGKFLRDHKEVAAWVALDDLDFSLADAVRAAGTPWIKYRSVLTNDQHCITEDNASEAIQILLNPPPEPKVAPKRSSLEALVPESSAVLASTEDSGPERLRLG